MAKVLRVCGDLIAGFTRLECSPIDTTDLRTLCEFLEAKLQLAKVTRVELWDGRDFTVLSPNGPSPGTSLPERSTLRVTATAAGARVFPYTLHDAAADGDHETLADLLGLGADAAESVGFIKKTTLHAAANAGQAAAVAMLLRSGQADPMAQDRIGRTPLHLAASRGHADVVATLLATSHRPVHAITQSGCTPLHEACYHGHAEVVEQLCLCRADLNKLDHAGRAALHLAAMNGCVAAVSKILEMSRQGHLRNQFDPVNGKSAQGRMPLHLAAAGGHDAVCAILLSNGAEVDAFDGLQMTPLELAGHAEHLSTVDLLIEYGARLPNATG
eukprot:SAG31_NODE_6481_length_2002_cov_1.243300_1_plen_329_part_00